MNDIEVQLVGGFLPTNVPSSSPDLSISFFIGKIYLVLDVAQLKCYTSTQCKWFIHRRILKEKKSLDQKAILPTDKSLFDILSTKMKSVGSWVAQSMREDASWWAWRWAEINLPQEAELLL